MNFCLSSGPWETEEAKKWNELRKTCLDLFVNIGFSVLAFAQVQWRERFGERHAKWNQFLQWKPGPIAVAGNFEIKLTGTRILPFCFKHKPDMAVCLPSCLGYTWTWTSHWKIKCLVHTDRHIPECSCNPPEPKLANTNVQNLTQNHITLT